MNNPIVQRMRNAGVPEDEIATVIEIVKVTSSRMRMTPEEALEAAAWASIQSRTTPLTGEELTQPDICAKTLRVSAIRRHPHDAASLLPPCRPE